MYPTALPLKRNRVRASRPARFPIASLEKPQAARIPKLSHTSTRDISVRCRARRRRMASCPCRALVRCLFCGSAVNRTAAHGSEGQGEGYVSGR
eukprot:1192501-Prorocentrum_minimum.AAC.2